MLVSSTQYRFPAGSTTDMIYFLYIQVCSTGVDEVLMKDEFAKLSMTLVQGAATCLPPLPLTTIVVQVSSNICFRAMILCMFPSRNSIMPMSINLF